LYSSPVPVDLTGGATSTVPSGFGISATGASKKRRINHHVNKISKLNLNDWA
jgi:hypothetical protein